MRLQDSIARGREVRQGSRGPKNRRTWQRIPPPEVREAVAAERKSTVETPKVEPQTRLLDVAARVARRKYLPSLEKCRTINDARCVVRKMDKEHVSLAAELKEIWDAYDAARARELTARSR